MAPRRIPPAATPRLLPLGALAAGFGLFHAHVLAQPAAGAPATTMAPIAVKAQAETDASSLRATTTSIGKAEQDLRDLPQSLTVLTEKLLQDRRVDTLKQALHQAGGVTFMAAEGGEEDVRLRGFSLAASGDIHVDGLRDPAFYDRDTFDDARVELLRGSASMLFGRGSTGGVVNQVLKQAVLADAGSVSITAGNGRYARATGDFNLRTGARSGLRVNVMKTLADNWGNRIDKHGLALNQRWGIGSDDEFVAGVYRLRNHNGINYGLPWLRVRSAQPGSDPSVTIPGLDPTVTYAAASDYSAGGVTHGTLGWIHRDAHGGQLRTTLRQGTYDRDQRASAIRFCQRSVNASTGVVVNPDCPATPQGLDTVGPATLLVRGTNNKVQDMHTTYAQSDYSGTLQGLGLQHALQAGIDLAHERFTGHAMVLPPGVTLDKNSPRPTLGTPDDGSGWVDESLRRKRRQAAFDAKVLGLYAQDLVEVAPHWKLLAGLRHDRFQGRYQSFQTADGAAVAPGTVTADRSRSEGLWSRRFGVLFQPTDTQSFHASYGTSFNTSGDTYQYDLPGSNTPPEGSRNIEVGGQLDLLAGRLSTRFALFQTTKTNERNRDSPAGTPIDDYLLSGRRHAAGVDLDIAGRITRAWEIFVSYAWIPSARIDAGNPDGSTLSGERVGQRPSLTPLHSGSVWTTLQLTPALRVGAGINARSAQTPNRNPAGIVAPGFATLDLMAETAFSDALSLKLSVLNAGNRFYADALYTGHAIQGAPRTVQATLVSHF